MVVETTSLLQRWLPASADAAAAAAASSTTTATAAAAAATKDEDASSSSSTVATTLMDSSSSTLLSSSSSSASRETSSHDNNNNIPGCEAYDWILEMHWHRAMVALQNRPVDALYQDGDTWETTLHLACQNHPPVRLIRKLIECSTNSNNNADDDQSTPNLLMTTNRGYGQLPIHVACRYNASIEVIRELLRHEPKSACFPTKWGQTPLKALWDSREPIRSNFNYLFWNKVTVILQAVAEHYGHHYGSLQGDEDNDNQHLLLVHAAVSLGSFGCPEEVLEHVLVRHPDEATKPDCSGLYPLHIAVGPTRFNFSHKSQKRRKYKPREREAIHKLLRRNPEVANIPLPPPTAATADCSSSSVYHLVARYPLHEAIVNGHTWYGGIQALYKASPQLLMKRDPQTKLHPFQLAAAATSDTNTDANTRTTTTSSCNKNIDLDSIYGLLRARPDALLLSSSCCDNNNDDDDGDDDDDDGDGAVDTNVNDVVENGGGSNICSEEASSPGASFAAMTTLMEDIDGCCIS